MSESDKYSNKNPLEIPENNFDDISDKFKGKNNEDEGKTKISSIRVSLKPYITIAAIFILIYTFWFLVVGDKFKVTKNTENNNTELIKEDVEEVQPNNQNSKQKTESQKVAFITRLLNLTVEEAQAFWPVYNEYMNKKEILLKEKRALLGKFKTQSDNLTNKELEKLSDDNIEIQVKEAELSKIYHQKFKTVLPIKKVVKYYQAENQFQRIISNQK